ncbi:MAG: hypothetical protein H8F28_25740, partial [Fibrella sp.]|nr:hypothetical protein [Armatimonadota bacterium]
MNVRIRPGGIVLFILAIAALIYRLLYTLLWEQENDNGPLLSLFSRKTAVVAPRTAPAALASPPVAVPQTAKSLTEWVVLGPIPITDTGL